MPNTFEAKDPRGWIIICTEDCWINHILARHPELTGFEEEVKAAIESPSLFIAQHPDRPTRHLYYARRPKKKWQYLKVVVEVESENSGAIITAFLADSPKQGEKPVWPIQTD